MFKTEIGSWAIKSPEIFVSGSETIKNTLGKKNLKKSDILGINSVFYVREGVKKNPYFYGHGRKRGVGATPVRKLKISNN